MVTDRFSIRSLISILVAVPLLVTTGLGGWITLDSVANYYSLKKAVALGELARASGSLILAMPFEGAAKGDALKDARSKTDQAHASIVAAYQDVVNSGADDSALTEIYNELQSRFDKLQGIRSDVDGGANAGGATTPIVMSSADIIRRIQFTTNDVDLTQAVAGYYALLQVNEGYQTFNPLGSDFFEKGSLDSRGYSRLIHGQELIAANFRTFRELSGKDVLDQYDAYWQTDKGKAFENYRALMIKNEPYVAQPGEADGWGPIVGARKRYMADLATFDSARMADLIEGKLNNARNDLIIYLTILLASTIALIAIGRTAGKALSRSIMSLSQRMTHLAKGDTSAEIPGLQRTDAIGEMAQAVEIFRKASMRNAELEAEADANRQGAEHARIDMQRRAEEEAAERLRIATSGLAKALKRLAAGDLAYQITEPFAPDFESLRRDFNQSVEQLGRTLSEISSSISSVEGGSHEISSGIDDLSKRTEHQAASLEETAAALDEITTNVNNSAQRTEEARGIAVQANQSAHKSAEVVLHAEEAMRRIEEGSQQISKIIGVIDQIAFQTNLLALNAGVEAARAGDAGKGFAVVAQEVRELAQRSAQAAKEIKELIGRSAGDVEGGVKLVRDAGQALTTIGGFIAEINKHVDAIASSSKEQATGIAEVNAAINAMDQATQQNAAMVEQSNAASASLANEAQTLRDLVERFTLKDAAASQANSLRQTRMAMAG